VFRETTPLFAEPFHLIPRLSYVGTVRGQTTGIGTGWWCRMGRLVGVPVRP